jgi:3-oxoacyl-[acyl-carrier protein] reductase
MNLGIENKIAIVTGASKGIGLAISKALVSEGVKVLLVARNEELLKTAVHEIRSKGGIADFLIGDVANSNLPELALEKIQELWGESVDILINNAGGPPVGGFLEQSATNWDLAIQTNLLSVVKFCTSVAPNMKQNNWGRIVSITSTIAKEPSPAMVLSATVRSGVAAFTKAISNELAPYNITVNVICPGGVLTERLTSLIQTRAAREKRTYDDVLKESQSSIPMQRFATPEEIANAVLYLVSEPGGYITGVNLAVDGGLIKSY